MIMCIHHFFVSSEAFVPMSYFWLIMRDCMTNPLGMDSISTGNLRSADRPTSSLSRVSWGMQQQQQQPGGGGGSYAGNGHQSRPLFPSAASASTSKPTFPAYGE